MKIQQPQPLVMCVCLRILNRKSERAEFTSLIFFRTCFAFFFPVDFIAMSSLFPSLFLLPSRPIQRQKIFMSESIARFFLSILSRRRIFILIELPRSRLLFFPVLLVVERRQSLQLEEKKRQPRWQGDQRIRVSSFLAVAV